MCVARSCPPTNATMITFRNSLLELGSVRVPDRYFPKHTHDEFVISANLNGHEHVWIDGKTFEADLGTLTTYNPGEVQSSIAVCGGTWRCASLYVQHSGFEDYFHSPFEFGKPYAARPDLTRQLISMVSNPSGPEIEESCVSLLRSVIAAASGTTHLKESPIALSRVKRIQDRLLGDISATPDLRTLAASEGISPAYLVRSFHRHVGLPPLAWHMQQRISHARRLLRCGRSIVDVALDAGFADQAHFTKTFVRFMGMTPGQFRSVNF
jgi:AraC family transcriptional regulator, chemosensory pili system protein ChpD